MRTWKAAFGLLLAAMLAFGMLVPLALPRRCPVNRAAFERIEEGMTVAEVEKILGGPEGDYSTEPRAIIIFGGGGTSMVDKRTWYGDEGEIEIGFADGCVLSKEFFEHDVRPVEFTERLRWRLGRLKDRCLR